MSDQLLALFTSIQLRLAAVRDEEDGQTFVEWLGVMVVVVALVGIASGTGVLQQVADAIGSEAKDLISGIS